MITTPVLLTDKNIELICGQLRAILQRQQLLLESDWQLSKTKTLNLEFSLALTGGTPPGRALLKMEYEPLKRTDSAGIPLWDSRQEALPLT